VSDPVREAAIRYRAPLAFGGAIAGLTSYAIGMPPMQILFWALAPFGSFLVPFLPAVPFGIIRPPDGRRPDPEVKPLDARAAAYALEKVPSGWLPVIVAVIGMLCGIAICVVIGVPEHSGTEFDEFTLQAQDHVLRLSIPVGARAYQAVQLKTQAIETRTNSPVLESPKVEIPSADVSTTPMLTSTANAEYVWIVKGEAGTYLATINYKATLFPTPKISGRSVPNSVPITNTRDRVIAFVNGASVKLDVLNALGVTVYTQNVVSGISSLIGFILGIIGAVAKTSKDDKKRKGRRTARSQPDPPEGTPI